MRDYSFDELQEMQEKALRRVQHMQARSRELIQNNAEEKKTALEMPTAHYFPPKQESAASQVSIENTPTKPGRISMPLNLPQQESEEEQTVYPKFSNYFAEHNQKEQEKKVQKTKSNLFDTMLQEPDEALLFMLLLLLKADGQNETLLLALLYVML